jgi:2-phosphosulfolactate phosphatase
MPCGLPVYVHLLPSLIPPGALKGRIAVVVDVLRATTAMVHALASGCEAVIPCGEIDEARRAAAGLPPGTAILGGERGGLPIEGFDVGNSPSSFTPELCRRKTLVMTTTNGTRAILASLEAERVLIAAFVNLKATLGDLTVNRQTKDTRAVHVVCAGTEGFISAEDSLLAGALVGRLHEGEDVQFANDEAQIAASFWRASVTERDSHSTSLGIRRVLMRGRGGHNVTRIGLQADISDAAKVDQFDLVAELHRDPLRITATRGGGISPQRTQSTPRDSEG